ncbi:MAG: NADH-ubiquinone oxidoreductase-F iron-sulfur binding region domain-containing protein [Solirubrobacteraceae bacterium]
MLPRLLATHDAPQPAARAARGLIDEIERSGLRGRGGALFPTAVKLRSVAARRGRRVVVVNGAEGEPMSVKDRVLLERSPHLVLDGAVAAAAAVGADTVVVAIPSARVRAHAAVDAALARRDDRPRICVAGVPDAFLSGEETALIAALEGRAPKPTLTPPRPSERGLKRRPTLVQNTETLAHIALIAGHGPEWFRALGSAAHPGSTLVTLDGCVAAPGVHEIAVGTRVGDLLERAGGLSSPARAVLLGGYHGTWVDAGRAVSLRLQDDELARRRLTFGAGVVVVLPQSACPVAEVSRVMTWLAGETAGQCGPCVHGLAAIAAEVAAVRAGRADRHALDRLRGWSGQIAGRGACHHPDGSSRFLTTALALFEPELELHRRFGACESCDAPAVLATPSARAVAA